MPTVDQLQAELALARANAARYRLLLEHSDEVSWMADCATLQLTWLGPAAARQFGYTLANAGALGAELLGDLAPRLARHAAGDGDLHLVREAALAHADGRVLPVEIASTLIVDAAGVAVSVVGVVRDLSARRELAEQQKKFASMLSHEFRTPLSTIDGAVQRLEMTGAHHDEGTRKRYRKIQTAVDRMLALLDDYLSPERMASIGRRRQPNEVSPLALLENAAEQARARRAAIRVVEDGLPQWIRCDPAGMRLVLDILLDNAIKYTDDSDEITLVGKKATEGGIELSVSDLGAGIPADEVGKLFDRGFRGRSANGVPGSGLGLYMARAVVEVHGGTLTVENFSESGKKFRIWLPIPA